MAASAPPSRRLDNNHLVATDTLPAVGDGARKRGLERECPVLRASNTTKSLPRPCIFKNAVMGRLIVWRARLCQQGP